jgi:hypothetical protein
MFVAFILLACSGLLKDKMPDTMTKLLGLNIDEKDVLAISFISRMSFIMLLFHALIFVVILARNETAAYFHDGLWGIKFLLVGVAYFATFWMDNKFFNDFYLPASKIVSIFYLIY